MIKIRHLVEKNGRFFFQPTKAMRAAGFSNTPLGNDENEAQRYVEAQNTEWDSIRDKMRNDPMPEMARSDFDWLINKFQKDPTWFGKKAKRTQQEIDYCFRIIAAQFGPHAVRIIERRHCRAFYNKMRTDGFSVHKTRKVMKWFVRLLWFAIEIGARDDHPGRKLEMEVPTGRHQVWTPDEIESVISRAMKGGKTKSGNTVPPRPSIAMATRIAYDSSLPQQDILALTWPQFDGRGLTVKQIKPRGEHVELWLPLSATAINMLAGLPRSSSHIIISEDTGRRYTDRNSFSRIFRKFRNRAGVEGKTFQDIRRTALTELGNHGATNAEIVKFSGHDINSRVLKTYIKPDRTAAENAAAKRWGKEVE